MRQLWHSAVALILVAGVTAAAYAGESPDSDGGDNPFGPKNQLATAERGPTGLVIYWKCAGTCAKGDSCCRPFYSHP